MNQAVVQKGFLGLAVLLALFYIVIGVGYQASGDFDSVGERVAWGLAGFLAGALILAGLLMSKRSPRLGLSLLVLGAVPPAVAFWWTIVLPIVALLVAWFGVRRALGFARERKAIA